jgi:hypothetical protein
LASKKEFIPRVKCIRVTTLEISKYSSRERRKEVGYENSIDREEEKIKREQKENAPRKK